MDAHRTVNLWRLLVDRESHALATGALRPIPTRLETVEELGIQFGVRVRERPAGQERAPEQGTRTAANPFLFPDPDLLVAELSPTHRCLLNKFPVVEHHLLAVTRTFEEQDSLLGLADFEALALCLEEIDALAFYNAGGIAGASQRHKHLQIVPLPLRPAARATPLDALVETLPRHGGVARIPGLPFLHGIERFAEPLPIPAEEKAHALHSAYGRLLESVGMREAAVPGWPGPHNLLTTRSWMLVVPRAWEHAGSISVNGLAYAGSFFVEGEEELAFLRRRGPMSLLADVALKAES